jgi:subtilisin family serine protease
MVQVRTVYIVTFNDDVVDVPGLARQLAATHGSTPIFTYTRALRGFAAPLSELAADALLRNPNVESVEPDQQVSAIATQSNPTWGIDRIDQRNLPLDASYTYNASGRGVTAYILDTGIRPDHVEFGGRASAAFTAISDSYGATDCNGHGTHVAGTVGGGTYGLAKDAALVGVRVLDCEGNGTISGVIAGVDWVAQHAQRPAVANMSLTGGASSSLDGAVTNAIAQGITFVVAGGNSGSIACNYSPARASSAITVGATDNNDSRASYSNYGSCLDLFAPGSNVTSAWYSSPTALATASGTSMASPHVAGVVALVLETTPSATPSAVANAILGNATTSAVSNAETGSPNLLLFSGFIGGGSTTPVNLAPVAAFATSCSVLSCSFNASASSDDNGIVSYTWTFGDGTTGNGVSTSRTYGAAGSYAVVLTVTDAQGLSSVMAQSVTVTSPPAAIIALSASVTRKGQNRFVNLSWTGASAGVSVLRNGGTIATVNGTTYQDNRGKTAGSATYQVCASGSCSNAVTVNY